MTSRDEKERRRQLRNNLDNKAAKEFEDSLPMSRDNFKKLFDYLDTALNDKGCADTNALTKSFLEQIGASNLDGILEWLADKGGYCDCEILANVEEQFE